MAAVLKCTKVTNTGDSLFVSGSYWFKVDFTNPTTSPPTPGSVSFNIGYADAEDPSQVQAETDAALALVGGNTMNWTL